MELIYRHDPYLPIQPRKIDDPAAAIAELESGNVRFRQVIEFVRGTFRGELDEPLIMPLDPMTLGVAMVDDMPVVQEPFGVVLGCSDARVPLETVLGQGCNHLFVVRVAGNVLGSECLGSIDYAVANMKSVKVLLVLGHLGCGAVTAAVSMYLSPSDYPDLHLSHSLRTIVDRIMFAVRGAANALERVGGPRVAEDPGYRAALLEVAIYLNAALNAFDLERRLGRDAREGVQVVYGVFDIGAMTVRPGPAGAGESSGEGPRFATPPGRADEFDELASEFARAVIARASLSKP